MASSNSSTDSTTKKRKKLALGKGLDALIPDAIPLENPPEENTASGFLLCDIAMIEPNRYQPRTRFSEEELAQLAESIRSQGIIQPILARKGSQGYELVAGERRLRAARLAGLDKVPVIVKDVSDAEMLEMSIVENIQRENLNPMEEADAYQRLITEFGLTQEQAAVRVGKSRSAVANFLRLRQLPEPIKASIMEGRLSMGHARALLGADTSAHQSAVWKAILRKGLSVRQTEELVKKMRAAGETIQRKQETSEDRHLKMVSDDLSRRFGTRVQIKRRGKRGRLEIEFYSDGDLNRLLEMLNAPV